MPGAAAAPVRAAAATGAIERFDAPIVSTDPGLSS
jgi:hypothetical protein